jgi:N-methylhydantoinase B/oxoprolinase/acetone carboxylase alpha subunit
VIREIEFLEEGEVSILSERRERAPFGLQGGEAGTRGRNLLNGVSIGGRAVRRVAAGDRLRIETPGGGGYGKPEHPAGDGEGATGPDRTPHVADG